MPIKKKLLLPLLIAGLLAAALVIAGLLSARPTDVYGLTGSFAPEVISISLVRSEASLADDSLQERFAYFELGDPGYAEALETIHSLRFRRSPLNILRQFIPAIGGGHTVKEIDGHDYGIYIHLGERGEDWDLYLSYWAGWEYWDDDHKVSLPLTGEGAAADAKALGDLWWELATPLDSYDIENME